MNTVLRSFLLFKLSATKWETLHVRYHEHGYELSMLTQAFYFKVSAAVYLASCVALKTLTLGQQTPNLTLWCTPHFHIIDNFRYF